MRNRLKCAQKPKRQYFNPISGQQCESSKYFIKNSQKWGSQLVLPYKINISL